MTNLIWYKKEFSNDELEESVQLMHINLQGERTLLRIDDTKFYEVINPLKGRTIFVHSSSNSKEALKLDILGFEECSALDLNDPNILNII